MPRWRYRSEGATSHRRHRVDRYARRSWFSATPSPTGAGDEHGLGISGWLARYMGMPITNLRLNGARTANVRALLRDGSAQVQVRAASVVVLSIGGNDLYGDSIARVLARVFPNLEQEITVTKVHGGVAALRRLNPTARVDVVSLYKPYHHSPRASTSR